jgi:hypothetical protein
VASSVQENSRPKRKRTASRDEAEESKGQNRRDRRAGEAVGGGDKAKRSKGASERAAARLYRRLWRSVAEETGDAGRKPMPL